RTGDASDRAGAHRSRRLGPTGGHTRLPVADGRRVPDDAVRAERRTPHPRRRRARPRSRRASQRGDRERADRPADVPRVATYCLPAVRQRHTHRREAGSPMTDNDRQNDRQTILGALTARAWSRANRELLAKAITELWYEEVIDPECTDGGDLRWKLRDGTLTARARWRALGWWRVEPQSLSWETEYGEVDVPDAADLLADVLAEQKVAPATLANLVAELSSTLLCDALFHTHAGPAAGLVDREPIEVEADLRGHPWIIANKGRVGFDIDDVRDYAPESARDVTLMWLAAGPEIADTTEVSGLDHRTVVREQVGDEF